MTVIHKTPQIQMHKSERNSQHDSSSSAVQMKHKQMPYDKYKYVPKQVMEVAEGMESQFTDHLLKQMKKSSGKELGPAEKIYHSMLDSERSKMMAKTNTGLGIKDVIIREFHPQFEQRNFRQPTETAPVEMYKKINSQKGESI